MSYISVSDASKKFKLSPRRIQQLCAQGKIEGAMMLSGIWAIPEDFDFKDLIKASKKGDAPSKDLVSINKLCDSLSISLATGRNWLKLGKIEASCVIDHHTYFTKEYVRKLKMSLKDQDSLLLKSRRNKKYVNGNCIHNAYVSFNSKAQKSVLALERYINDNKVRISDYLASAILSECTCQLILDKMKNEQRVNCLKEYLEGSLDLLGFEFLVDDLILNDKAMIQKLIVKHPKLFNIEFFYEDQEDVLGLIYIFFNDLSLRKATGFYYTPAKVVQKLSQKLFEQESFEGKRFFDPCCGSGNFLLKLHNIPFEKIYGNDIDLNSVKIAKINLALKFNVKDRASLDSHISNYDYLTYDFDKQFDVILGNPPWGYEFSPEHKQTLVKKFSCAKGNNVESYSLFIEKSLKSLSIGGRLAFVLPESILNVKSHSDIRTQIHEKCNFEYLSYLGTAFDKVQCPCIILQLQYGTKGQRALNLQVETKNNSYYIKKDRELTDKGFCFAITDEEYQLLQKLENSSTRLYLKDHATFALGIVTGSNTKLLETSPKDNYERVLKGSDVQKYKFKDSYHYLLYKKEAFQQSAPIEYYRAKEKLLYRFICNQLVFAYDDKQTLSLNSCNVLIPRFENMQIKYILAILNSRIAQFYFKKSFNSLKVLKSHLEKIPLCVADSNTQKEIVDLVDSIRQSDETKALALYESIDSKIAKLYGLDESEYALIKDSMKDENLFLS